MKIEIAKADAELIQGTSAATGRAYSFKKQDAFVSLPGKKYPVEFQLTLDADQPPYPVGVYTLNPESLYVDNKGRLSVGRVLLVPMAANSTRAAG